MVFEAAAPSPTDWTRAGFGFSSRCWWCTGRCSENERWRFQAGAGMARAVKCFTEALQRLLPDGTALSHASAAADAMGEPAPGNPKKACRHG
jgi:hypothetical protein